MPLIFADLETYSETPIGEGAHKYAQSAEVQLFQYAIDDGPVRVLDLTDCDGPGSWPREIHALREIEHATWIAHNAGFDRTVLNAQGYVVPLEQWRCTMAMAYEHALPGGLDALCDILRVSRDKAKMKIDKELMRLFCQPLPKNMKLRRATKWTHPDKWEQWLLYAEFDIHSLREIWRKLPRWNHDPARWHLDQRINDRGFAVDLDLVEGVIAAVEIEKHRLAEATLEHTGGAATATERDKLLEHILAEYGVALPDMRGSTLERRVDDPNLPLELRELLALRLEAATASTAKYKRLRDSHIDGRVKGTLQYAGAARTRRWAGRRFQPQNLPRPTLKLPAIEFAIRAFKSGCADLVLPSVMAAASSCARGTIVAPRGRKLVVADLANIEGRVLAWLAGERWKLDAFNAFDRGEGPDLYALAYAKSFGVTPESVIEDHERGGIQRQVGKVQELAMGYEGGVGAFVTFALAYRIDLDTLPEKVLPNAPAGVVLEAENFWEWCLATNKRTFGLPKETFIACDVLKRLWRAAHPNVVKTWKDLKEAFMVQVNSPVMAGIPVGEHLRVERRGSWITVAMPGGKKMCYPAADVNDKGVLSYKGVNQYSKQWSRIYTYGGKMAENITQSVSCDVLAHGMAGAELAGFDTVLTVHDEIIAEAPDNDGFTAEGLSRIMATVPAWAPGLPLAAKGFEAYRYRKD